MKAFWMVWNPDGHPPSFSHGTKQDAVLEARRLAQKHQDNSFFVLEAIGVAQRVSTTYTPLERDKQDDEIPF